MKVFATNPPGENLPVLDLLRRSGLVDGATLARLHDSGDLPDDTQQALDSLVRAGVLTRFQSHHLAQGKYKGFVLGSYRILRPIGKGAIGLVYEAEHVEMHRRVAVKVLRTDRLEDPGTLERFHREARATAALDHPNIVRVHDVDRNGDTHYLVMELVEGESLEVLVRRRGRLPVAVAANLILQAAQGLQHAHDRGVVHRDVKPANLLVDRKGVIKILDMGLARFFDDTTDNLTERLGGKPILGSPDYIAPEQALHRLDIRSDVYSLGATLYDLLLGRPPFLGRTVSQKLLAHQVQAPTPPHQRDPRIPIQLSAAVLRMLAKNPDDRFQTPAEVVAALAPWAGPTGPLASAPPLPPVRPDSDPHLGDDPQPAPGPQRARTPARVRLGPWLVGLAVVAVAALCVATGVVAYQHFSAAPVAPAGVETRP